MTVLILVLLALIFLLGWSFVGAAVWLIKVLLVVAIIVVLWRIINGRNPV